MTKQQKRNARYVVFAFIFGCGVLTGYIATNFTWSFILVGFFAFIGFCVLAVLTYAAVTDEPEETRSYPANWGFDKKFEE